MFNQGEEVATYKYKGNELLDYSLHYLKHPIAFLNGAYNVLKEPGPNSDIGFEKPSF